MESTNIESAGAELEKFAASSAGILCWSTSSSDHSKSSDKSYSFVQKSDGCVIRIPGPQVIHLILIANQAKHPFPKILGYMLQFTDNDETTVVPGKLPDGFLLSDADYNSAFAEKPAAHAADPLIATPTTNPSPRV
jgi:hypothetical protein